MKTAAAAAVGVLKIIELFFALMLTTHRKPMWVVDVSSVCGDLAAGR